MQWELSCSIPSDVQKDGRADMTKLMLALRNFANVPRSDIQHTKHFSTLFKSSLQYERYNVKGTLREGMDSIYLGTRELVNKVIWLRIP